MTQPTTPKPKTLVDAIKYFASTDNCRDYMVSIRWPNGVTCPSCGSAKVYFDKSRNGFECATRHPHRKFSLKTGTVFEDSPIGLDKWLPTVWMIANMKNGVSSHELAKSLGVTQKTAWFMLHRVRLAMQDETGGKLAGDVEADETYIGGKARNMHAAKRKALMTSLRADGQPSTSSRWAGKVPVMGILERKADGQSRVRTMPLEDVRQHRLHKIVRENIEEGSTVYTDALRSYQGITQYNMEHYVIDHAEEYARGNVHTNGLESYWSLLKRALGGTYISVEPFHLFRYLDEQAFRFNNRKGLTDAQRFMLALTGIVGRRLTYKDLIGAQNAPNGN